MKIDVYYDYKKNNLAIKSREKKTYGSVVERRNIIGVRNAMFMQNNTAKLYSNPMRRMRTYVRGERVGDVNVPELSNMLEIKFDEKNENFVDPSSRHIVTSSEFAVIIGRKIFAYRPKINV